MTADKYTTNIQWKGTKLCMDLNCPECGENSHFDGMFAYIIECPHCSSQFQMPTDIGSLLKPIEAGHNLPVIMSIDAY